MLEPYLEKSDILLVQLENIINAVFHTMKLPKYVRVKVVFDPASYSLNIIQLLSQITPRQI
ncbi:hypothetical protein J3U21_00595 [Gilliamella sp. B2776]|uniref:hypothetical protein n=1 Tax=unclassified Gilliamella TaxID=2685620 RepID=UPI00226A86B6|nr:MULTISPECIES: hypothetical protein [unclassified Gilliamella]MCX8648835.1 hypothetical protein [Gilliamella sp. B2779]MCX8653289.1 hypothetical protein [Gilliamella sp. B2737]MCX8655565.1 hypothetical protein [Gilliamella sp. B2894]MCX8664315.1 hypothetical protein [Gilliamella sp. B2887]MCX8690647.1 hypothetical protein [Gilliamella sp. B2776]